MSVVPMATGGREEVRWKISSLLSHWPELAGQPEGGRESGRILTPPGGNVRHVFSRASVLT